MADKSPIPGSKEPRFVTGTLVGTGMRFGVVAGRFNSFITDKLLEGALDAFARHGVELDRVDVAWVPGAFEIPLVARRMAKSGQYDAVVCLGAVIRGATPHFDHVANAAARGVAQAAWESDVPVIFGVLTVDTIEQAIERAGTKAGNKGFDAAVAAIETAQVLKKLPGGKNA
jgi:6,7-dimethyl-8-ribityllumazine synthase